MNRTILAAVLFAAATLCGGCSTIAHAMFPCVVPKCPEGRLTRETPDDAVDFLIDAFKNRRINDIYETLHPEFIQENGAFTEQDFSLAYEHFEQDFVADAESLATAARGWTPPTQTTIHGNPAVLALVRLRNQENGAEIVFALENWPQIRIVTNNQFLRTIEGPVDKETLVRMSDGRLGLPSNFPLTSIEHVSPQAAASLTSANIVRVEITDDWRVRLVPTSGAKNIRFMDKIKEHVGK